MSRDPLTAANRYHPGLLPGTGAIAGLLVALVTSPAHAEGYDQISTQPVTEDTVLYVDILDTSVESILFEGSGTITVTDPDGTGLGTYESGEEVVLSGSSAGAFKIALSADQDEYWDISVQNPTAQGGRLFSYQWYMNTETWSEEGSFDGSFYALVEAGSDAHNGVIEMKTEGLSGREWQMVANSSGVDGEDAGRSVEMFEESYTPQYPIYLLPPTQAVYDVKLPGVSNLTFQADPSECGGVAPGYVGGTFSFDADQVGGYHLLCDLNGDSLFDLTSNDDLALSGATVEGTNEVYWDGSDNSGDPVPAGNYRCHVTVTVGEFHFIAADIETSYPGLRMFEVDPNEGELALPMYWNDYAIQDNAEAMPNGEVGSVTSGPEGLDPGDYESEAVANENARAWGHFEETGKGNFAYLDTFVWLDATTSGEIEVKVVDSSEDLDFDGVPDACQTGYYRGGCAVAPAGRASAAALLAGLLALLGVSRRRR